MGFLVEISFGGAKMGVKESKEEADRLIMKWSAYFMKKFGMDKSTAKKKSEPQLLK